jgi:hypothetical protein
MALGRRYAAPVFSTLQAAYLLLIFFERSFLFWCFKISGAIE